MYYLEFDSKEGLSNLLGGICKAQLDGYRIQSFEIEITKESTKVKLKLIKL